MAQDQRRRRRSLFRKYLIVLFAAVSVPLLANGASEAYFGYRDQREMLDARLRTEAEAAAVRIEQFLISIRDHLGWTVQHAWSPETDTQHRLDALGVLRQVPAIISITLVDADGRERLFVSRVDLERHGSGIDRSGEPAVIHALMDRVWYGPVTYAHESEPFMAIAVAGNRRAAGVSVAEVNLKLIWDVVLAIRVGRMGHAFVLDRDGRLIAHPDISRVLRGSDDETSDAIRRIRTALEDVGEGAATTLGLDGESVVAVGATIPGVDWLVLVEQPLSEAFAPIYLALWRTAGLLFAGLGFAGLLAYLLARRMTGPIRILEEGADRIGAGQFEHRLRIASGDEFERLAERFNRMAEELALSQERSERIDRLKRFLAPQVAELVETAGNEHVLAGQRTEIVVVFCDLRGFTAFSAHAEPDEIMALLGSYYEGLGTVITDYEATLTSFSGDGLMVLLNAPVPCEDPAGRAVSMALDMQSVVQRLIVEWRSRGHSVGFGIGLAMGPATVGRVGNLSRVEYTAIGNVVNLASRLCSIAQDRQILADPVAAAAVQGRYDLASLGEVPIKGYDRPVAVFEVKSGVATQPEARAQARS